MSDDGDTVPSDDDAINDDATISFDASHLTVDEPGEVADDDDDDDDDDDEATIPGCLDDETIPFGHANAFGSVAGETDTVPDGFLGFDSTAGATANPPPGAITILTQPGGTIVVGLGVNCWCLRTPLPNHMSSHSIAFIFINPQLSANFARTRAFFE